MTINFVRKRTKILNNISGLPPNGPFGGPTQYIIPSMLTDAFDFALPVELVALRPVEPRDHARLLVVHPDGRLEHRFFHQLGDYLRQGDILSFNDSRVIHARLAGTRPPRQAGTMPVVIEVTLHRRDAPDRFAAFVKPAKRLAPGDRLEFLFRPSGGDRCARWRRSDLGVQPARRRAGSGDRTGGRDAPAALHRQAAAAGRPRPGWTIRPCSPAPTARWAAPTAGLHFHAPDAGKAPGPGRGACRAQPCMSARHLPAVTAKDTGGHVMPAEARHSGCRYCCGGSMRRGRAAAVSRRSAPPRCGPWEKRGRWYGRPCLRRGDAHLHHPRATASAPWTMLGDEFPPAALHPVHAGQALHGAWS